MSLNVNSQESFTEHNRPVPALLGTSEGAAYIGGISPKAKHYGRFEDKSYYKGKFTQGITFSLAFD